MSSGRTAALDRLEHMLDAARAIEGYVARGRATFDADSAVREAILYQLIVIGEAAKAAVEAEPGLETELADLEWSPMARMRDRVTHHYWKTDPDIVWSTAAVAVPRMRSVLEQSLSRLSSRK